MWGLLWCAVATAWCVFELTALSKADARGLWPTHWVGSANRPPFIKPQTFKAERQKPEKSSSPDAVTVWLCFISGIRIPFKKVNSLYVYYILVKKKYSASS